MSTCRQEFTADVEAAINAQINMELYASIAYQVTSIQFQHDNRFTKMRKRSDMKRQYAEKLQIYMTMRGGTLELYSVQAAPTQYESALSAMELALQLERDLNESMSNLHSMAAQAGDAQCKDFLDDNHLCEQTQAIKEMSDHVTQLKRVVASHGALGEYMFKHKDLGGRKLKLSGETGGRARLVDTSGNHSSA
jgi:ferritin